MTAVRPESPAGSLFEHLFSGFPPCFPGEIRQFAELVHVDCLLVGLVRFLMPPQDRQGFGQRSLDKPKVRSRLVYP
jgi:hypothetical protein